LGASIAVTLFFKIQISGGQIFCEFIKILVIENISNGRFGQRFMKGKKIKRGKIDLNFKKENITIQCKNLENTFKDPFSKGWSST
jgi:hypothetical protein